MPRPLRRLPALLPALLLTLAGLAAPPASAAARRADPDAPKRTVRDYDGAWAVNLVCSEFTPVNGTPVAGYAVAFQATIKDGVLQAQHGKAGTPGSFSYSGHVDAAAGKVTIDAKGITGEQEYNAGRVGAGSAYTYSMRGKLDPALGGSASRMELRPCRASFSRR